MTATRARNIAGRQASAALSLCALAGKARTSLAESSTTASVLKPWHAQAHTMDNGSICGYPNFQDERVLSRAATT